MISSNASRQSRVWLKPAARENMLSKACITSEGTACLLVKCLKPWDQPTSTNQVSSFTYALKASWWSMAIERNSRQCSKKLLSRSSCVLEVVQRVNIACAQVRKVGRGIPLSTYGDLRGHASPWQGTKLPSSVQRACCQK
jgi:hypothetical protein